MEERLKELLKSGADEFGVSLTGGMVDRFGLYMERLIETNKVMNLTAITDPEEMIRKHFVDSLSLLSCAELADGATLADIGSGAGFPGIPVKIARPGIGLTCIDSLNKRVDFLKVLAEELNLSGCSFLHDRAEEAGRKAGLRGNFDVVTARAVAGLRVLLELCLPFVKTGGVFCAMKGPDGAAEAGECEKAARLLGGEIEKVKQFRLPGGEMERTVIIVRKSSETPGKYPRSFAKIQKSPL